jgi:hypothetical protein
MTGSPGERAEVQKVAADINSSRCVNIAGDVSFEELPTLYALSEMLLTNDSGPAHFASTVGLRTKGGNVRLDRKTQVKKIEENVRVPWSEIYRTEEYYEITKKKRLDATPSLLESADDHIAMARFCRTIAYWKGMKDHLDIAVGMNAELESSLEADYTLVNRHLAEEAMASRLQVIEKSVRADKFGEAQLALTEVEEGLKKLDNPELRAKFEDLQTKFKEAAAEYIGKRWFVHMPTVARDCTQKKDPQKGTAITLPEARTYARSQMYEDIALRIATESGLEVKAVKNFHKERPAKGEKEFAYGSGTFVEKGRPEIVKPTERDFGTDQRNQPRVTGQRLRPDEWWETKASTSDKIALLMAIHAEAKLNIVTFEEFKSYGIRETICTGGCGGNGTKQKVGNEYEWCNTCYGCGHIRYIKVW